MTKNLLAILFFTLCAGGAQAKLVQKTIGYKQGGTALEGYLVYDDAVSGKRPGILVTHDWMGLTDKTKKRADMLAELGYVAFADDIYGKGVRPANADEAGKLAGQYKTDRKLLRSRMQAGLKALNGSALVDSKRLASIGYCFGGTAALELARAGADLKGTVTFHGGLDSLHPEDAKNIKGKILALHGADDPFVPAADLAAFENEMRMAKVDWQLKKFGNSVHSFTDQTAGTDNSKGAAYNEKADKRSWKDMQDFFAEIL
jgi:dienelactone hydrolase